MIPRLVLLALFALPAAAQTAHIEQVSPNPKWDADSTTYKSPPTLRGGRLLVTSDVDASFSTYQWPGVYFEAAFKGTQFYFATDDGRQNLHVTIDHQPPIAVVAQGRQIYRVSGLKNAAHFIRVDIVSESQAGPDVFRGFAIPPGEKLLTPHLRTRQIEFIGDSHTVGYGNTSPTRTCTEGEVWSRTDTSQSFGPLIARRYDADYQINAISGRGIVRNYNGFPADTLPVAYPYVLFDKKNVYYNPRWRPAVIVIALGTNDFSTPLNPGEPWKTRDALHADYESTYLRFLRDLRARNPHAYFVLWATDMANGEIESEVRKVADAWKASGETRVAFLPIDHLAFSACNFHPSLADDRTIAGKIEQVIDAVPSVWSAQP